MTRYISAPPISIPAPVCVILQIGVRGDTARTPVLSQQLIHLLLLPLDRTERGDRREEKRREEERSS
jgi:hypothetical protein